MLFLKVYTPVCIVVRFDDRLHTDNHRELAARSIGISRYDLAGCEYVASGLQCSCRTNVATFVGIQANVEFDVIQHFVSFLSLSWCFVELVWLS